MTIRKIIRLFVCSFTPFLAIAQAPPAKLYRIFSESGYNTGFTSIQETSDGGYIGIGSAISTTMNYTIVVKMDAAARVVWQNSYVASGQSSEGWSIRETSSGYIAMAAVGTTTGPQTLVLMRLGPTGGVIWKRAYPAGEEGIEPLSVEPTADGGFLASAVDLSSPYFDAPALGIKVDSSGNIVWQKDFESYHLASLHSTPDGGTIIAASPFTPASKIYEGHILKLDAAGNTEWDRSYSLPTSVYFTSARPVPDGGYVISGYYSLSRTSTDVLLLKVDGDGNILSTNAYQSTTCSSLGPDAQNEPGGGYLLNLGYCTLSNAVARLDTTGAILWQQQPTDTVAALTLAENAVSPTSDGGYVAAGFVGGGLGHLYIAPQALMLKSDSSGALPGCAQNGFPNLQSVAAPALVAADGSTPTQNTTYTPEPVAITAAPSQLPAKLGCTP